MPLLDDCIGDQFEPGNIGSSSGDGVTPITLDEPSLDFSKSYNSQYVGVI